MRNYWVRRLKIGKTPQLDMLSQECGRERTKAGDPDAKPPHKRKRYFRIEYKRSAMKLTDGKLRLSNGKSSAPLILTWPWDLPNTVVIHWTGTQYEAIATYGEDIQVQPQGDKVAGIDLGEVHMAVSYDGTQTHILNGRLLRSKAQYRNKLQATLNSRIDGRMKKGSKRRKRVVRSKKKQLRKIQHQIKDIEHKQTSRLITTLHKADVRTLVIGVMAPPTGLRFSPHVRVAREEREAAPL
jgi:putative transposase